MFEEVDARLRKFNSHKPLSAGALARLDSIFEPWFIYGSNALEGNTLSLGDTIYLIREGKLPGGKREEEYLEVKGQQAAYAYLHEAVAGQFMMSEKLIREFHTLLTEKLDSTKYLPGRYKDRDNQVRLSDGSLFPYVSHVATPAAMGDLVAWFEGEGQGLHPVERAARFHYRFILVHPFLDGNGRTARLLANFALLRAGHVMTVFRADERRRLYLDALRSVDLSVPLSDLALDNESLNYFPLVSFLEQELLWSYDRAFEVLEETTPLSTEDLVRRFAPLEERKLSKLGMSGGERERLERAAEAVRELTDRIGAQVGEIAERIAEHWTELWLTTGKTVVGARDALEGFPNVTPLARRREILRIGAEIRGRVGLASVYVVRKADNLTQLNIPPNICQFVIYAEPHRLVVTCLFIPRASSGPTTASPATENFETAALSLSLDPQEWRSSELERFVIKETDLFLSALEAAIESVQT